MKKQVSKVYILIISAFAVLLLVLLTYYFLYSDIVKTKKNTENLSGELKSEIKKNEELEAIRKNIKLTIADRETLDALFVKNDFVVDFVELVESTARKSGLRIETKNIEPKDSEFLSLMNKDLISITLETNGSWQNNMQFLSLLGNLPYKISIVSADLSFGLQADTKKGSKDIQTQSASTWSAKIVFDVIKTKE